MRHLFYLILMIPVIFILWILGMPPWLQVITIIVSLGIGIWWIYKKIEEKKKRKEEYEKKYEKFKKHDKKEDDEK